MTVEEQHLADMRRASQEISTLRQHNENLAESIKILQDQIEEFKRERGECPEYYRTSPIHQFVDYQKTVLIPLLKWLEYDEHAIHCILSASEHYFRMGRKTVDNQHDCKAVIWWVDQAYKTDPLCWSVWEGLIVPMLKRLRPDGGPITEPNGDTA